MPDQSVDPWEPLRAELTADVRRVADRLRSMSPTRLAAPPSPAQDDGRDPGSRADAAREVAGVLAAAAARLEAGTPGPPDRDLPVLADFAAGDQVAVTGHDLLAALDGVAPDGELRDVVADAAARLADLRRRL